MTKLPTVFKRYNIKLLSLFFTLVSMTYSCQGDGEKKNGKGKAESALIPEVVISSFPKTIMLEKTHVGPINVFKDPKFIELLGDTLVVIDSHSPLFYFLSLPNFELLGEWGIAGRGKNEFRFATYNFQKKNDPKGLWIQDGVHKQLFVEVDKAINDKNYFPSEKIFISPKNRYDHILVVNQDLFASNIRSGLKFFDPETGQGSLFETIIAGKHEEYDANSSWASINEDHSLIVLPYYYTQRIDIFDVNSQQFACSVVFPDTRSPYLVETVDDLRMHYLNAFVGKEKIYCMWKGGYGPGSGPVIPELHVFSYSGEALCRYKFSSLGVGRITIDEERGVLYGISAMHEQSIYTCKL